MLPSTLSQPVVTLARAAIAVQPEDSLGLAVRRLRESGAGIIAMASGTRYVGAITERSLAEALAKGYEPLDSASVALELSDVRVLPNATGAEVLRAFSELGVQRLLVVDQGDRLLGVVSPSDLYPRPSLAPRPPAIGGMATPFGVYLTTGVVSAGASGLALVTTGMLLWCLLAISTMGADWIALHSFPTTLSSGWAVFLSDLLVFALFGLFLRALPLSKTHAAEHKVVHAIERGEELLPAIVNRMPRVHPRCGTNLSVGATLFLLLSSTPFLPWPEMQPLLALIVTLMFWRRLGNLVQRLVTTAPPKEKQIKAAIQVGEELMSRFENAPRVVPTLFQRVRASGLLHVMLGALICTLVALEVARYLNVPL